MVLPDFLFLLFTPEFPVSLAPLLDEGSLLVLKKSFSEMLWLFISKLSSKVSSSQDHRDIKTQGIITAETSFIKLNGFY